MQIYITRGADSSGPYSLEDVRAYFEQGILLPDDLAYHEGLAGWTPLEEVLETAEASVKEAPEPLAPMAQPVPVKEAIELVAPVAQAVTTPKKNRKPLVIAGAVAGLVVFGGIGTVVYLKFIKGDEASSADVGSPKKKISAYAQTNGPGTNSLPANPNSLIPGLPGATTETNAPPPVVTDLREKLLGKTLRLAFRKAGDSDVTFFPDGTGTSAELPARIPQPFKWSLTDNRVKLAFNDGSRTNILAFEAKPLALGNSVTLLPNPETAIADGETGRVDGVGDAQPVPPPAAKLSPDQVDALLGVRVGIWDVNATIRSIVPGIAPIHSTQQLLVQLGEDGKSITGQPVDAEGNLIPKWIKEYDEATGSFKITVMDPSGTEYHLKYDPDTMTYSGRRISPAPRPGEIVNITVRQISANQLEMKITDPVAEGGPVEIIHLQTRAPKKPEPPSPPITPPLGPVAPPIPPPIPFPHSSVPLSKEDANQTPPVAPVSPIEPIEANEPASEPEAESDSARILEISVRRTLRKPEGELTPADFAKVTRIAVGAGTNKVSDLSYLVNCPNLESIFAQSQAITDLAPLAKLAKLKDISISHNPVKDLAPLAGLAELQVLWLQGAQVEDVTPLAGLAKLETLYLDRNTGLTDLKPLAGLPALRHLSLYEMDAVDLAPLASLPKLEKLNLAKLPPEALATLKPPAGLKELVFSPGADTDLAALFGAIDALEKLRVADVRRVGLRKLVDVVKSHKTLVDLGLPMGGISDATPLADLPNLKRLDLAGNRIENLEPIGKLENLNTLLLSGNRVEDVAPLAGCKKLGTLWLSGNPVTDPTPLHVMKQLRSVTLRGTPVTNEQREALRQAIPNCFVDSKRAK